MLVSHDNNGDDNDGAIHDDFVDDDDADNPSGGVGMTLFDGSQLVRNCGGGFREGEHCAFLQSSTHGSFPIIHINNNNNIS